MALQATDVLRIEGRRLAGVSAASGAMKGHSMARHATRWDRYAARCGGLMLAVTRTAVPGAQSAPSGYWRPADHSAGMSRSGVGRLGLSIALTAFVCIVFAAAAGGQQKSAAPSQTPALTALDYIEIQQLVS